MAFGKKAKGKAEYPETLYVRESGLIYGSKWVVAEDGRVLRNYKPDEDVEVAEYRLVRKVGVRTIVEVDSGKGT